MKNREVWETISRALTYMVAGMFLYLYAPDWSNAIGITWIVFAFLITITPFIKRLERISNWLHYEIFYLAVFYTSVAGLITTTIETKCEDWLIITILFLIVILALFLYMIYRTIRNVKKTV